MAQAFLLAASLLPVFAYSRTRVGTGPATWSTVAYGLFWPMQKAAGFAFHEMAFAPLVIATGILAMEERRWT